MSEAIVEDKKKVVLTRVDICEQFDISIQTLNNWVRDGHFPQPIKVGPHRDYWTVGMIQKFMDKKLRDAK
jgi:predicted DNA-binding transcriptional regulator AlpA